MELRTAAASENRAISGSPSGLPSPVSLSLRIKTLQEHRASDRADKGAKDGHQMSLRGVSFDYAQDSDPRKDRYYFSEDSLCVASSDISGRVTRHGLFSAACKGWNIA